MDTSFDILRGTWEEQEGKEDAERVLFFYGKVALIEDFLVSF